VRCSWPDLIAAIERSAAIGDAAERARARALVGPVPVSIRTAMSYRVRALPESVRPRLFPSSAPTLAAAVMRAASVLAPTVVLAACASPLRPGDGVDDGTRLSPAVTSALEREIAKLPTEPTPMQASSGPSDVENTLAPRRAELDALGPQWSKGNAGLDLGPALGGASRAEVQLGLKSVIQRAVKNNLSVQAARLDQGISDARLAQAEAVFDATLFADTDFVRSTRPQVGTLLANGSVLNDLNDSRTWAFTTGLRKPFESGGSIEVATSMDNQALFPRDEFSPNSSWGTGVSLGLTQPLLRGFGSDVTTSEIRIAKNNDRAAVEDLRSRLLRTVADAEAAYWRLAFARQQVVAAEWLVEVGIEVRDVLGRRREFDATLAQYANAVATVEQRKAAVLTARKAVSEANNRLKAILNDPDMPVGGDAVIVPIDLPVELPVEQNLRAAIVTAADRSPDVAKALLSIDTASIGVVVADNQRLPQLDLNGRLAWFGLDGSFGESYEDIGSGDFVEYVVGARFSQAIGNRAAEAAFRESRLARSKSVIAYRSAIQQAVLEVRDAIESTATNYELIAQNRAFRVAQAENLRALLVSEKTLGSLTPEFLQLKFQQQDTLARAQLQYVESQINYNIAISELHRAMGTGLELNQIDIAIVDPVLERPALTQSQASAANALR
jgi:outer membrane protein TolC